MFRTRIRTAAAALTVAAAAVLASAAPASAHDALVSSSPAADSTLTAAPAEVVLTFSNDLLAFDENGGTALTVVDASGDDWVDGEPAVSADTVTVPLGEGMPNGAYTVTWQVVSSDGHPTSGEFAFSLAAPEASATPTAETAETAEPEKPAKTAEPAAAADATPWPLLIGAGAVLLAAIIVIAVVAARRRR